MLKVDEKLTKDVTIWFVLMIPRASTVIKQFLIL